MEFNVEKNKEIEQNFTDMVKYIKDVSNDYSIQLEQEVFEEINMSRKTIKEYVENCHLLTIEAYRHLSQMRNKLAEIDKIIENLENRNN